MKKFLIIASAVAVAAGCAKVTTVDTDGPKEIAFEAYNYAATKAPITTATFPDDYDMSVHAIQRTGTDGSYTYKEYFTAKTFAKNVNGKWAGSQYWPTDGSLKFNAISPVNIPTGEENTSTPVLTDIKFKYDSGEDITTITATLNDNTANQADVMVATPSGFATADESTNGVPMTFNHVLSQIEVQATATAANAVEITSIELQGTAQAGELTATYSSSAFTYSWDLKTPARKNINIYTAEGDTKYLDANDTYETYQGVLVCPEEALTTDTQKLEVKYKFNGSAEQTYTIDLAQIENSSSQAINSWEPGKKYIYKLKVTANEILIAPSVSNWQPNPDDASTTGNTTVGGSN